MEMYELTEGITSDFTQMSIWTPGWSNLGFNSCSFVVDSVFILSSVILGLLLRTNYQHTMNLGIACAVMGCTGSFEQRWPFCKRCILCVPYVP